MISYQHIYNNTQTFLTIIERIEIWDSNTVLFAIFPMLLVRFYRRRSIQTLEEVKRGWGGGVDAKHCLSSCTAWVDLAEDNGCHNNVLLTGVVDPIPAMPLKHWFIVKTKHICQSLLKHGRSLHGPQPWAAHSPNAPGPGQGVVMLERGGGYAAYRGAKRGKRKEIRSLFPPLLCVHLHM